MHNAAGWLVEPDASFAEALVLFEQDRLWAAYAIADLAPPYDAHTRVSLARRAGAPPAAAFLVLRAPDFTAIVPHGDPEGVAALLAAVELPKASHLQARAEHLPALAHHFAFPTGRVEMQRMAVNATSFRPAAQTLPAVDRLGPADLAALRALYALYPRSAFTELQLHHGVFYGANRDGVLVAAGGTHVAVPQFGIAAVGNVFTAPSARGRGYATAITAAVTAELLAGGCRDVVLSVAADNAPAIHVYERLGYHLHCTLWEAQIRRKQ